MVGIKRILLYVALFCGKEEAHCVPSIIGSSVTTFLNEQRRKSWEKFIDDEGKFKASESNEDEVKRGMDEAIEREFIRIEEAREIFFERMHSSNRTRDAVTKHDDLFTVTNEFRDDIEAVFDSNMIVGVRKKLTMLEIGSYFGYTTRHLSSLFRQVIAIDAFQGYQRLNALWNKDRDNIFHVAIPTNYLPWNYLGRYTIDVAMVDSGHGFREVLETVKALFKSGSSNPRILIFDDYAAEDGVYAAVNYFIKEKLLVPLYFIGKQPPWEVDGRHLEEYEGIVCATNASANGYFMGREDESYFAALTSRGAFDDLGHIVKFRSEINIELHSMERAVEEDNKEVINDFIDQIIRALYMPRSDDDVEDIIRDRGLYGEVAVHIGSHALIFADIYRHRTGCRTVIAELDKFDCSHTYLHSGSILCIGQFVRMDNFLTATYFVDVLSHDFADYKSVLSRWFTDVFPSAFASWVFIGNQAVLEKDKNLYSEFAEEFDLYCKILSYIEVHESQASQFMVCNSSSD